MDANTIADIFNKKITKWNDPKIASQNQGKNLPDLAIITVHRSDDSGTTENFTDYLSVAAKDSWSYGKVQTWPKEITAENAQGTSGVVNLVKQREGAITYADASAITGLGSVAVKVGDAYVPFSEEAAAKPSRPRSASGPATTWRSSWIAPPPRPASTRSCWSPTTSTAPPTRTRPPWT